MPGTASSGCPVVEGLYMSGANNLVSSSILLEGIATTSRPFSSELRPSPDDIKAVRYHMQNRPAYVIPAGNEDIPDRGMEGH